jgi:purine-binding chemotaxis protein CheW
MSLLSSAPAGSAAAPPAAAARPAQYLTFVLGAEVFAIDILGVKEIIEYTSVTEVPMMPLCLRGVVNLRGAVVPVFDLSVFFGKPVNPVTKRTCIVFLEVETQGARHDVGVVVDAVNAVLDIFATDIEPPPAFGTGIRTDFIQGMAKVEGRFVILLDVNHIMAFEQMRPLTDQRNAPGSAAAHAGP